MTNERMKELQRMREQALQELIDAADAFQWQDARANLPDLDTCVLVWRKGSILNRPEEAYLRRLGTRYFWGHDNWHRNIDIDEVSHWRPMPKGPRFIV